MSRSRKQRAKVRDPYLQFDEQVQEIRRSAIKALESKVVALHENFTEKAWCCERRAESEPWRSSLCAVAAHWCAGRGSSKPSNQCRVLQCSRCSIASKRFSGGIPAVKRERTSPGCMVPRSHCVLSSGEERKIRTERSSREREREREVCLTQEKIAPFESVLDFVG